MRYYALGLLAGAGLLAATQTFAAESCAPGEVARAIDLYAAQPFSARSWRVLKGLGDPMIEPAAASDGGWEASDRFKKLVQSVAPDVRLPDSIGYECRLQYPAEVLEKRIAELGKDSPYVKQWVMAQGAVIAACNGEKVENLPPPLDVTGTAQALQIADREYQQASIAFYSDKLKALNLYRAIAVTASPHRAAARYNVANILANAKRFEEARSEAKSILADPAMASVHPITQELLGYIANREDTAAAWASLIDDTVKTIETPAAAIQSDPKLKSDYARALYDIDFAGIHGRQDDWWISGQLPENPTLSKAVADAVKKYPLVGWMIAGQTAAGYYDRLPWQMASPKWQTRNVSLIDRTLALKLDLPATARSTIEAFKIAANDTLWPQSDAAVAAATASCGKAPETAAAGLLLAQATRAAAQSGQIDAALDKLEAFPEKASVAYARTVLSLGRFLLGQGLVIDGRHWRDRLLTDALWTGLPAPERETLGNDLAVVAMWLAEDRAHWDAALMHHSAKTNLSLLNFLPIAELRRMAKDDKLFMEPERALLIRAAWTRQFARGVKPDAKFTGELFALNPDLKKVAEGVHTQYGRDDWTLTLLRAPGFGTLLSAPGDWQTVSLLGPRDATKLDAWDKNDKNWWCPFEPDRHLIALRQEFDEAAGQFIPDWDRKAVEAAYEPATADQLTAKREATLKSHPVVKSIGWKEIAALSAMPSAPKRLAQSAIAWAKSVKKDDGAAEALALAVEATHYGCSWHGGHGAYSKAAQQLLQTKFGGTEWAKRTPYWFDCTRPRWKNDSSSDKETTCDPQTWPKQKLPR